MQRDELEGLIPEFKERGIDLNLQRMRIALKAMGEPCKYIPAIQIAGTNGKGSIASFLKSSLNVLGIKAGITTSPHLVSWCERICTNGEFISLDDFRRRLIVLKPLIDRYQLTPFESIIAVALDHFRSQQVELLVLEVGLGGRLDATTAHPFRPIIAMAGVGLDHCEYLGKTLNAIAKEKASIIQPNSIVISAKQHSEVEKVLKSIATKQNATLQFVTPLSNDWDLGLAGGIQKQNAAVAKGVLEALRKYGWKIEEHQIRKGLAHAKWPGRLEEASWRGMSLLIDCAHNPHATEQLSLERTQWSGQETGIAWILAIQKQKDGSAMLKSLLKPSDLAWIVPVPSHTSWTEKELSNRCPNYSSQLRTALNAEEALTMILLEDKSHVPIPVITGSIYLIGDLIKRKVIQLKKH